MMSNKIIQGNSAEKLKSLPDNSIDLVVTDPPYRYGFMGKSWDKKQDFTEIWKECLRVLKPGGFAYIMNAPRSDCQLLLLKELADVGFNIEFSPIFWTYASGFPKAANMSKLIDKRLGLKQEVIGKRNPHIDGSIRKKSKASGDFLGTSLHEFDGYIDITKPSSLEAQKFDGGYAGFQPKPAVELINVVMKPLSEKSYIDQALENGKGMSWFDDCRIPYTELQDIPNSNGKPCSPSDSGIYNWNNPELQKLKKKMVGGRLSQEKRWTYGDKKVDGFKPQEFEDVDINLKGRFPANLLISDNVLDLGREHKSQVDYKKLNRAAKNLFGENIPEIKPLDKGDFSRYFTLDKWWTKHIKNLPKELRDTFPFLYCPKPTKSEKNKGLEKSNLPKKAIGEHCLQNHDGKKRSDPPVKNFHPTGKPIKLMSYLITLGSRPGDLILDPFAGSGTTGIACKLEDRKYIMIEKDPEYYEIMKARLKAYKTQHKLF